MKNILFTLTLLISFNSFGQTGEVIAYYESGEVKSKANYSGYNEYAGSLNGEMIYYNKNGEIEKIENYKDDVLIKD